MPFNDALAVRFVSLLPYNLDLYEPGGGKVRVHTFPAHQNPVRVSEKRETWQEDVLGVGHITVSRVKSIVSRFPDKVEGVKYIVSMRVAQLLVLQGFNVDDLVIPSGLLREHGRVVGCSEFVQVVTG